MSRLGCVLLILGMCRLALGVEELAVLYNGQSTVPAAQIKLGDWGYVPRMEPAKAYKPEKLVSNKYGLRFTTFGRYTGARIDFPQAIDTTPFFGVKNTYLEIYLRAVPGETAPNAAAPGTNPTVEATQPVGGPGGPGGPGEPGNPAAGGGPADAPVDPAWAETRPKVAMVPLPALKNLRFTFFTEKGQGLLLITPDQFSPKDEVGNQWVKIDIPLSLMAPGQPLGGKMTRMLITSDEPVEFMLGRLAFVRDAEPFGVKLLVFPAFLEAGKRIFFAARVEPGLSHYETTWDFDTRAGASIDAKGDRVTHVFDVEGNYLITCTVRDLGGGKEPNIMSMQVKVSHAIEGPRTDTTPGGGGAPPAPQP